MDIPDNHEWLYVALPYLTLEPAHVERLFWQAYCSCSGSQSVGPHKAHIGPRVTRIMEQRLTARWARRKGQ